MKHAKILTPILVTALLIGTVSIALGWTGYPRNGGFTSGPDYWSAAGDAYYTASGGYSDGGLQLYVNGIAQSETLNLGGTWELVFKFYASDAGTIRVSVYNAGLNSETLLTEVPATGAGWNSVDLQSLYHTGLYALRFKWLGAGTYAILDDVATDGAVSLPSPTATPTLVATSTPAATATYGAHSGSSAAARITVAPTTVYADSKNVSSAMTLPVSGTVTSGHIADVVITQGEWGLCMPTEVTQVFTDVPLCLTIPVYHVRELWLGGVDLIPGFTGLVAILMFLFIVRQLQER